MTDIVPNSTSPTPEGLKPAEELDAVNRVQDNKSFALSESLNEASGEALNYIVTRPTMEGLQNSEWRSMVDPVSGNVGAMRTEMESTVIGQMDDTGLKTMTESDVLNSEITRTVTKLYLDLTHYQVAWKIAQKTQQDISQLLRGG